jgi:hypothetical protein
VGLLGDQQVARLLKGVGLLGPLVDLDHAAPHRRGAVGEDPAEGEIRRGVGRSVLLQRVEVEVLATVGGVGAVDRGVGALAGEVRLQEDLAVGRAEAQRGPVELTVALDDRALGGEDPAALREVLPGDVVQVGVRAHDDLDDRVDQTRRRGVGGQRLLPHLGLGTLLEDDQRAPVQRAAGVLVHDVEHDRRLDAHAARHVDERSVGPQRVVARGERVGALHDGTEVALDDVPVALGGQGERHDHRPLRGGFLAGGPHRVLELEHDRSGGVDRSAGRRRERVEVELVDRGELPSGHPPERGQLEAAHRGDGALAARRQELRLGGGGSAGHLPDAPFHLQLDQPVHLDGVLHRELLDDRLDEAVDDQLRRLLLVRPRAVR